MGTIASTWSLLHNVPSIVAFLWNEGPDAFSAPQVVTVGSFEWSDPTQFTAGDFDRDGRPDLAIALGNQDHDSGAPPYVSILLNRGGRTFAPPAFLPSKGIPLSIVNADFDQDGNLDLAVAAVDQYLPPGDNPLDHSRMIVFWGKGDGTFSEAVEIASGMYLHSLEAVDLDGDGRAEIACIAESSSEARVLVFWNEGHRGFSTPAEFTLSPLSLVPIGHLRTGDLNGDRRLDLVMSAVTRVLPSPDPPDPRSPPRQENATPRMAPASRRWRCSLAPVAARSILRVPSPNRVAPRTSPASTLTATAIRTSSPPMGASTRWCS